MEIVRAVGLKAERREYGKTEVRAWGDCEAESEASARQGTEKTRRAVKTFSVARTLKTRVTGSDSDLISRAKLRATVENLCLNLLTNNGDIIISQ